MKRVLVLGGSGGIGRVAVRALAASGELAQIVVADLREAEAKAFAASLNDPRVVGRGIDARDHAALVAAIREVDIVLGCVGPFYTFGPPVLRAAIEARRDYVDVCDDLAPTRVMLELDAEAKAAGITALVGMGNSPGLANVLVRLSREVFFDSIRSVDILHIHGGEPEEGAAVLKHRIHAMQNDIPLFLDSKFVTVRQLEPSGEATVVESEFRGLGSYPVFPYPHPETITLPRYLPGVQRVTNMGVIFPLSYFRLTQDVVRTGLCSEDPLTVNGQPVIPIDVAVAHVLRERSRLLQEAGVTGPAGALKVVVSGTKLGEDATMVFQLSSRSAGAGEGTGIPAAAGTLLMARGAITERGVLPPEAAVKPFDLVLLALELGKKLGAADSSSIHIERIDAHGQRTTLPLPV